MIGPARSCSSSIATRDILESTNFDVPLEQAGREMNMPSDRPGVLMRRMLVKLLAEQQAPVAKAAE